MLRANADASSESKLNRESSAQATDLVQRRILAFVVERKDVVLPTPAVEGVIHAAATVGQTIADVIAAHRIGLHDSLPNFSDMRDGTIHAPAPHWSLVIARWPTNPCQPRGGRAGSVDIKGVNVYNAIYLCGRRAGVKAPRAPVSVKF